MLGGAHAITSNMILNKRQSAGRRGYVKGGLTKTNRYRGGQIVLDLGGREFRIETMNITVLIMDLGGMAAARNGG
jgi:hypothetical protein